MIRFIKGLFYKNEKITVIECLNGNDVVNATFRSDGYLKTITLGHANKSEQKYTVTECVVKHPIK